MPNEVVQSGAIPSYPDATEAGALAGAAASAAGFASILYVDGSGGNDGKSGQSWVDAKGSIQAAIDSAAPFSTIYVLPKKITAGDSDPNSYAETLIIPPALTGLKIVGVAGGRAQGNQPQIRKGSGSTALLTIRAPGCTIENLSFNGASSTGGGILLDEVTSTGQAFGTVIRNCFFKNCKGSAAAATGGAIMWSANGGAWQVLIEGNLFYGNRGGIVLPGTSSSRPTDVVIRGNTFGSSVNTDIDCDIYLGGGSGAQGVVIDGNQFQTVDVPAYATSPTAARYIDLTGCEGILSNNTFACITDGTSAKTFKAAGDAAKIPTTVRMANNWGEGASDGDHAGAIERAA